MGVENGNGGYLVIKFMYLLSAKKLYWFSYRRDDLLSNASDTSSISSGESVVPRAGRLHCLTINK